MDFGRYMAYSPAPSTVPYSPHMSGMRTPGGTIGEQEKYLAELFGEPQKLNPFVPVLPHSFHLLNQDQSGFEHGSPLITGGLFLNGGVADMNSWHQHFNLKDWEHYSLQLGVVGLGHKATLLVLLLRKQLEWMFLWISSPITTLSVYSLVREETLLSGLKLSLLVVC